MNPEIDPRTSVANNYHNPMKNRLDSCDVNHNSLNPMKAQYGFVWKLGSLDFIVDPHPFCQHL